jgi:hypothetical protein
MSTANGMRGPVIARAADAARSDVMRLPAARIELICMHIRAGIAQVSMLWS